MATRLAATVLLVMLPLLAWSAWVHRRNRSIVREQQRQRREVEDPCLVHLQAQQRSLDSSLARLRDSQGGRGHRYDVPWYLILGEQNAGKSSFVSRSDQRFALAPTDGATQRACTDPDLAFGIDWWVGDDAVLIDPPGEFISQPERPARVVNSTCNHNTRPRHPSFSRYFSSGTIRCCWMPLMSKSKKTWIKRWAPR